MMIAWTTCGLLLLHVVPQNRPAPPPGVDACNVVWNSASTDASGSMLIGNGVVGLNVWVEPSGDLVFYIARVDAWSECDRLLKLGRIRVTLSPSPLTSDQPFRQELVLSEGRIAISTGIGEHRVEASLFVHAASPVIFLEVRSQSPLQLRAALENWRTEPRALTDKAELQSSWTMRDAPDDVAQREARESADVVYDDPSAVVWYHRNEHSIVPFTLHHQGLDGVSEHFDDPLIHRTFGGRMESVELRKSGKAALEGKGVTSATIRIATHAAQTSTAEAWRSAVTNIAKACPAGDAARRETAKWWREFWNRSWIVVDGDAPASADARDSAPASSVTQAYVLQRWTAACASRGSYPPKFNGSIFTVEPRFTDGQTFDADWRKWGGSYWWQNTRLIYFPMLAAGDWDLMRPLFDYYESALRGCRARTRLYYGADGVYFPETMTTFATYANGDYGWKRGTLAAGDISPCPWWQWAWNQSLELTQLMLDYAQYTEDDDFLRRRALPMAREALAYFDTRFSRGGDGKLVISPTQALETYWHGVVNDAPAVAGIHAVCDALLALPPDVGTRDERELWTRMKAAAPELPTWEIDGARAAAPAQQFVNQRSNCETPELYPLFPFRRYGLGKSNLDLALNAFRARKDKSGVGWTQDGLFAAMLGLAEEARADVVSRIANQHPRHRFPTSWGPNFDWLPDQDHGSNLLTGLQLMLMQCDPIGGEIRLLPAWPHEWNASFKLHAPRRTVVEGRVEAGRLVELRVTPDGRRRDVVICGQ